MCYLPTSQDDFHLFLHPGHTTPVYIYYSSLGLSFYYILTWYVITWHIQLTFSHYHSITLCVPMHCHMHYIECLRLGFKPCSSLSYYFIRPWIIHIFNTQICFSFGITYLWYMHGCLIILFSYITDAIPTFHIYGYCIMPIYHIMNYFPWLIF